MKAEAPPLWTCPRCGVRLVTRNLWHSCGRETLEGWFARMPPRGRALYNGFEALIAACGEYHVSPAKTRITFLGRVRFAGVTRVSDDGITCSFAMPYPLRSPRFLKVLRWCLAGGATNFASPRRASSTGSCRGGFAAATA